MTAMDKPRGRTRPARKKADAKPVHGALRAQGVRTRNAIIAAARGLLLEGGSLEFSLREIADRAGITISNLQYYFPSRQAVLRAAFEPIIDGYLLDLRRATADGADARATLAALAARALRDAKDRESSALWAHFLSLVAMDPGSAEMLDSWYEALVCEIASLVRAVNPALDVGESETAAVLIVAMADGVCVRNGVGNKQQGYVSDLDAAFFSTIECLLDGCWTPSSGGVLQAGARRVPLSLHGIG